MNLDCSVCTFWGEAAPYGHLCPHPTGPGRYHGGQVEVVDRADLLGISVMPDGSLDCAFRIHESHLEPREPDAETVTTDQPLRALGGSLREATDEEFQAEADRQFLARDDGSNAP